MDLVDETQRQIPVDRLIASGGKVEKIAHGECIGPQVAPRRVPAEVRPVDSANSIMISRTVEVESSRFMLPP